MCRYRILHLFQNKSHYSTFDCYVSIRLDLYFTFAKVLQKEKMIEREQCTYVFRSFNVCIDLAALVISILSFNHKKNPSLSQGFDGLIHLKQLPIPLREPTICLTVDGLSSAVFLIYVDNFSIRAHFYFLWRFVQLYSNFPLLSFLNGHRKS